MAARACSSRSSVIALFLVPVLAACTSPQETGHALEEGIQSSGTIGHDSLEVGQQWNLALPLMRNISPEKIRVKSAQVDNVPEGIEVIGYGAYNRNDTEGMALISRTGSPGMPDFDKLKNHFGEQIGIDPNTESDIYYVVKVKITGRITENLAGATFTYDSGEHTYKQSLPFEAALRLEGTPSGP
ncbi:hypothetical protein ACWDUX_06415 [Streptomyces sp. NPDC003444]|uniref:hypothetical protein n=1 Tax=unclassified Streptomyces TaxID=2593676 RepID=UPI00136B8FF2|nr:MULTISPECIES: hypothetical protein [unclassified Streptomyces]MZE50255.1 hypothetical protein [Streptomyces sp. SID5770]